VRAWLDFISTGFANASILRKNEGLEGWTLVRAVLERCQYLCGYKDPRGLKAHTPVRYTVTSCQVTSTTIITIIRWLERRVRTRVNFLSGSHLQPAADGGLFVF